MKLLNNIFRLAVVVVLISQVVSAAVVPTSGYAPAAVISAQISCSEELCDFAVHKCEYQSDLAESRIAVLAKDYGYKAANLMVLKDASQNSELKNNLSKQGFSVTVPEFVGISNLDVKSFLNSAGLDLDARWQEVLENSNMNNPEAVQIMLQTKTLPDVFIQELRKFSDEIGQTFECLAAKEEKKDAAGWCTRLKNWASAQLFFSSDVDDFLKLIHDSKLKYAVCGANKEDASIVLIEKADSKSGITKANILRAMGDYFKNYVSPESIAFLVESKGLLFFERFSWSILIQSISTNSFGLSNVPEDFKSDFINAAEMISNYIFEVYGEKIATEYIYPFMSFKSGEELVKCKALTKVKAEDFEPNSEYFKNCNGGIDARAKRNENNGVYFVINPGLEDKRHMVKTKFNVCQNSSDVTQCSRIENNRAITTCRFTPFLLACTQYVSSGIPNKKYEIKDKKIYQDGVAIMRKISLPNPIHITEEYKKLLDKGFQPYFELLDSGSEFIEITKQIAPKLNNVFEEICKNIPILKGKKVRFFVEDAYGVTMYAHPSRYGLFVVVHADFLDRLFSRPDVIQDVVSTFAHEIGHIYQSESNQLDYLSKILTLESQKKLYVELVNCEAQADIFAGLLGYGEHFIFALLESRKSASCLESPFLYESDFVLCGEQKELVGTENTMRRMGLNAEGPVFGNEGYSIHPNLLADRVPKLLALEEKKGDADRRLNKFIAPE